MVRLSVSFKDDVEIDINRVTKEQFETIKGTGLGKENKYDGSGAKWGWSFYSYDIKIENLRLIFMTEWQKEDE